MRELKQVAIIGLGAVGAAYAARFYDKDPAGIMVIGDEVRRNRLKAGVAVNGKTYHFNTLPTEIPPTQPLDLILVAVKFQQLEQAIQDMKNLVGPDTLILSLMNGISSEAVMGEVYGMEHLLYGMCMGIDALRQGDEISYTTLGHIHFGERDNRVLSPKVQAVKALFNQYNIPYVIPEDMYRALWWKFMINVGINQTSAVLRAPYRIFHTVPEMRQLMEAAMREVAAVSIPAGVGLGEQEIIDFYPILAKLAPDNKTSMLQDIEAGRKTEVEMLGGTVCALGKQYGVPTPVNETLYRLILTMEQMVSRG